MKEPKIIFPENVVIGKSYIVPCLFIEKGNFYNSKDAFVPINTHLHTDHKDINFKHSHWHVDWRFLPTRIYNSAANDIAIRDKDSSQLEASFVLVFEPFHPYLQRNVIDPSIHYKRMVAKRNYGVANFYENFYKRVKNGGWPKKLHKSFCNAELKQVGSKLICPHKGAHIDKNCKDSQGNYVCPAHLLRFNPKTLKVIQP